MGRIELRLNCPADFIQQSARRGQFSRQTVDEIDGLRIGKDFPRIGLDLEMRCIGKALHGLERLAQFRSRGFEGSQAFGIDRGALAVIMRRVDAVEIVQAQEQPGSAGSLLAARTRKPRPPNSEVYNDAIESDD